MQPFSPRLADTAESREGTTMGTTTGSVATGSVLRESWRQRHAPAPTRRRRRLHRSTLPVSAWLAGWLDCPTDRGRRKNRGPRVRTRRLLGRCSRLPHGRVRLPGGRAYGCLDHTSRRASVWDSRTGWGGSGPRGADAHTATAGAGGPRPRGARFSSGFAAAGRGRGGFRRLALPDLWEGRAAGLPPCHVCRQGSPSWAHAAGGRHPRLSTTQSYVLLGAQLLDSIKSELYRHWNFTG